MKKYPVRGSAKEAKSIAYKKLNLGRIDDWKDFHKISDALKMITDDPEGGEVNIRSDDGQVFKFTMPPLKDRKPLDLPKIK
jgi:hypothetical protein